MSRCSSSSTTHVQRPSTTRQQPDLLGRVITLEKHMISHDMLPGTVAQDLTALDELRQELASLKHETGRISSECIANRMPPPLDAPPLCTINEHLTDVDKRLSVLEKNSLVETMEIQARQEETIRTLSKAVARLTRKFESLNQSPRESVAGSVDPPPFASASELSMTQPPVMKPLKAVPSSKKRLSSTLIPMASASTVTESPRHYHEPTTSTQLKAYDQTQAVQGTSLGTQ